VRAPGRADAQVRLLTVHGAKGLEADCVLLLDTDTRPQKAETMGVLVDWPGEQPAPSPLHLFGQRDPTRPPVPSATLAAEQQARSREELNMLYVAMTRAKHCLALSSVQPATRPRRQLVEPAGPAGHGGRSASPGPGEHGAEAAAPC
jgi:ATP-dependent helicase/nuclease subunit A